MTERFDTTAVEARPSGRARFVVPLAAIAVAAAVGVGAGIRLGDQGETPGPATTAAGPGPQPTPQTPNGSEPVDEVDPADEASAAPLRVSRVASTTPGARTSAGVPVGYPRTEDGAVAAATTGLKVLAGPAAATAAGSASVKVVAAPTSAARLLVQAAALARTAGLPATGRPPAGRAYVAVVRPQWGAFRVAAYSPATARVVIWHYREAGLVAAGGKPPAGSWVTSTLTLQWSPRPIGWRVSAWGDASGPPAGGPPRTAPPAELRAELVGSDYQLYADTA